MSLINLANISSRIEGLFSDRKKELILKKIYVPKATYYRSINTHKWNFEHIIKIANYFNVSIDWIATGKKMKKIN